MPRMVTLLKGSTLRKRRIAGSRYPGRVWLLAMACWSTMTSAGAADGLQVPGQGDAGRSYSDLLWTKEDYRAWLKGTGYRASTGHDTTTSVFPLSFVGEPVEPVPGVLSRWELGERNWRYATDNGLAIQLGNVDVGTSVLAAPATLGGVSLAHSRLVRPHDAGKWSLSFSLGALDYSDSAAQGDLSYGPMAAHSVIHYGLNDHLALESGIQMAPDLVTTSLGARLDAGSWGVMRAGVAQGGLADQAGRRYQAAYDVEFADELRLSVRNEWDAPGFADLGHYRDGVTAGVRRNWEATIPTRRWGDISGSYESFRPKMGEATERFGFSQQFWYSPNLRIGIQVQRDIGTGDYDIGLRFSVPIN